MTDITDKNYKPSIDELDAYIGNSLFSRLRGHLEDSYGALYNIEYSGDTLFRGWNIKFYKAGRSLCRLYPHPGYFKLLIVVGRKEKERVEASLPEMSKEMQEIYNGTKEGMGQRWLMFDVTAPDALYDDALTLIAIRRASK